MPTDAALIALLNQLGIPETQNRFFVALVSTFLKFSAKPGQRIAPEFDAVAVAWAAATAGDLITQISEDTRKAVNALTQRAIVEGWTVERMQEELQDSYAFSRDRALVIARTEGARAANAGEATRWAADGVRYVEIIDGQDDEPCRHADGQIWTVEEFRDHPIAHPNCHRRAIPLDREFQPTGPLGYSIDEN